jgi:hypothetical protein
MGGVMRHRAWVAALLVGCQGLPSSVPLSNTGGVLEDDGTARDRRAHAGVAAAPVAALLPTSAATSPAHLPPARGPESTPDAGAPAGSTGVADGGIAASPWAGEYYGSDKLVRHFEGDNDDVELDDKAHTRVEEPSPGAVVISIVNSATADTICTLKATAHGTEASVDPGQSCFSEEGASATVTSGHASVAGERLALDFSGKIVTEPDEDGDTIEFELEYHFDGKRR